MRQILVLVAAGALALSALGCAATAPVVGSWELVEVNGQPVGGGPAQRPTKILNATHFAFGSQAPEGPVWAGGGRYEWDEGLYTEFIAWHSVRELVGATAVFHDRIEGDLWHHDGDFEAGGRRFVIEEVWRRLATLSTNDPPAPPSP